jgi:hypothetical protein
MDFLKQQRWKLMVMGKAKESVGNYLVVTDEDTGGSHARVSRRAKIPRTSDPNWPTFPLWLRSNTRRCEPQWNVVDYPWITTMKGSCDIIWLPICQVR